MQQVEVAAAILAEADRVRLDPTRFAIYADDPVGFCHDILGVELWDKQKQLLQDAALYGRVAVRSGHGVGKSFAVACLVLWWLYGRQGRVVTTAPTRTHLADVLWSELHAIMARAPVWLPGERNNLDITIDKYWYACGVTTDQEGAFQGRHHPRLLLVGDEAAGLSEQTHLEMETCATGAENCITLIGNPTSVSGTFYTAFKSPDWHTFKISCLDHPNVRASKDLIKGAVTAGWVEKRRRVWGEHHPLWYSRVLGDFPAISTRGIVPLLWIEQSLNDLQREKALQRALEQRLPRVAGLDVARYGDNLCVLVVRRGDAIEQIHSWGHTTLTETAGKVKRFCADLDIKTVVVDASGLGAGVYDMLVEEGVETLAYNGGHRAFNPGTYGNRRTEMWWHLRQRFERGRLWLPEQGSEVMVEDLVTPEYEVNRSGRIQAETKENLLNRGVRSPDFGDALAMCFALSDNPEADLLEDAPENADPAVHAELVEAFEERSAFGNLPDGF